MGGLLVWLFLALAPVGLWSAEGPPVIIQPPRDLTVLQGNPAVLAVVADGSTPLNYQWLRQATLITNATEASLTVPITLANDDGTGFSVIVSNSQGSATSTVARLTIDPGIIVGTLTNRLLEVDSTWRFDQRNDYTRVSWYVPDFNDSAWSTGPGNFYVTTATNIPLLNTPLTIGQRTYYFRTRFQVADLNHIELALSYFVDDGAVFYLNGVPVHRIGMPNSPLLPVYTTPANRNVGNAVLEGIRPLASTHLKLGENLLAVEVHQQTVTSTDIVFGAALEGVLPIRLPDTVAPRIESVSAADVDRIAVRFSERVELSSALDPRNYSVSGGAQIGSMGFGVDPQTVLLTTTEPLRNNLGYRITVSGVRDRAVTPNTLSTETSAVFYLQGDGLIGVGVGAPAGRNGIEEQGSGSFNIMAGGSDIGGRSDQFQFHYHLRAGDFDLQMRLDGLELSNPWAKAGLMARESLSLTSRYAGVFAPPELSGAFFQYRSVNGGPSLSAGALPLNYPDMWLRLRRVGTNFTGFAGYDGTRWTQLGSINMSSTNPFFVGIAVSSRNTNQTTTARVSSYGITTAPIVETAFRTREPAGPSTRNGGIVISEIMYRPSGQVGGTSKGEYIELYNSQSHEEDLTGWRLEGAVNFSFPRGLVLPPGGLVVVAAAPSELAADYKLDNVLGPWGASEALPNNTGIVRLRSPQNAVVVQVQYDAASPWPAAADGTGHSLVLSRPSYGEADSRAWSISDVKGGSPGRLDRVVDTDPLRGVAINEIFANSPAGSEDYLELFNNSSTSLDISGAYLSDNPGTNKFRIPSGTLLAARSHISFTETVLGFGLNSGGERVYLVNPSETRVIDAVEFEPQASGVASGRYPDGTSPWQPLASRTPGAANAVPVEPSVVINEIMYHPISEQDEDEYIELYNRGVAPVDLSGWRLGAGVRFNFPPGTLLGTDSYLVVAKNLSQLRVNHPHLTARNSLGDYSGTLANGGERIALYRPEDSVVTQNGVSVTNQLFVLVDEVAYDDGGRWGDKADGGGSSLELVDAQSDNRLSANWAESDETRKSEWSVIETTGALDNGRDAADELMVMLLGRGEALFDDAEVIAQGGTNQVRNSGFESGRTGWVIQGNHVRSTLEPGVGVGGSNALRIRASGGGDNGANRIETDLFRSVAAGQRATIRGKFRWLSGHPDVLMVFHGSYLEAPGRLKIPKNLGTPGLVNSRRVPNAGPAITEVGHFPRLPLALEPVRITARVHDRDGLAEVRLHYRIDVANADPMTNTVVVMNDSGEAGDAAAGDGLFSAILPGFASGRLIAFHIEGTDKAETPARTQFPALFPSQECLVRFGDPVPAGSFGVYRFWMTADNIRTWTNRERLSNEPLDCTFLYNSDRVVYNAEGRYRGSPFVRNYGTPTASSIGSYVLTFPSDEPMLGADELNLDSLEPSGRDPTALREITSFWMASELGLPYSYQRFVHLVINGVDNASRDIPIYADVQQPNSAYMESHYADDSNGEIYKVDDWFEFDDGFGFANENARLELFTTTGGVKKVGRYRWSWEKKFNKTLNDDYSDFLTIVDAVNDKTGSYVANVEATIDVHQWLTTFALRHMIGDWDGYGYNRGKNQFIYRPENDKWKMLLWDLDFSLGCNGGHGPQQDLFECDDPVIARMYNHPHFRRIYYQALQRMIDGPFAKDAALPQMRSRFEGLQANNITGLTAYISPFTSSGAQSLSIPAWIDQRRAHAISRMPTTNFALSASSIVTNQNLAILSGRAPLGVHGFTVNGRQYNPTWSYHGSAGLMRPLAWTLVVPLKAGANTLRVQGLDQHGNAISDAAAEATIEYRGLEPQPQDALVFNEILVNPIAPDEAYVEIRNRSSQWSFDVSNWRINGLNYEFPPGTLITNDAYLVIAKSRKAIHEAYGSRVFLFDEFGGLLDPDGETLTLIRPGLTPEQDFIVDQVRYEAVEPWPPAAGQLGAALQLQDPEEDNHRAGNWDAVYQATPQAQPLLSTTNAWRFNQTDNLDDVPWTTPGYNDSAWESGPALFFVGTAPVTAPKNTLLKIGRSAYYFRTYFNVGTSLSNRLLRLFGYIDDGAVVYLNGKQAARIGMAQTGVITNGTFATRNILTPTNEGPIVISSDLLVPGDNLVAVEVHQSSATSTDVFFGLAIEIIDRPPAASATPGAPNSLARDLPPFPSLWLNEVAPINANGLTDNAGDRDPWVEIYNSGTTAVALDGLFLSDTYSDLTKWALPSGSSIAPGQFKVVWLDGEPSETTGTHWHSNFRLAQPSGSVALSRILGATPQVIDYLNFSSGAQDRTFGDFPDGQPFTRQAFALPTPGAANDSTPPPATLFINEWMASNTGIIRDPTDGDADDWFELYNPAEQPVDLGGYFLTDNLGNRNQFRIPAATIVPARGFLLVWADNEFSSNTVTADLHVNFQLARGGESIGLFSPDGLLVDSVTFGSQTNNISQGRFPDGSVSLHFMPLTSPGRPNQVALVNNPPLISPIADFVINESARKFLQIEATDPNQPLRFSLAPGAPAGSSVTPQGQFRWRPSESQGPGTYTITVEVVDSGSPPAKATSTFTVAVQEVNSPPLFDLRPRYINAGTTLQFNTAGDDDLPLQALTFSLGETAADGLQIVQSSGVVTWTPQDRHAPGEYHVPVIVQDSGIPPQTASHVYTIYVLARDETLIVVEALRSGAAVQIRWLGVTGRRYQVEYKNDLAEASWQALGGPFTALSEESEVLDAASNHQRFYRVTELP